ncbi:hypothetical protein CC2G_001454 [Coprinopsis cinerea AmutBmut pab1-1]|nr:hypothetical protein CC2G_001454 [Coprinopsis cinerea AmutBmut pab1-1]
MMTSKSKRFHSPPSLQTTTHRAHSVSGLFFECKEANHDYDLSRIIIIIIIHSPVNRYQVSFFSRIWTSETQRDDFSSSRHPPNYLLPTFLKRTTNRHDENTAFFLLQLGFPFFSSFLVTFFPSPFS